MKRNISVFLSVIFALSSLLTIAACTHHKGIQAEGITFTDALGRQVALQKNPERTAALLGSFAEVWTLAGGSLCAAAGDAWDDFDLRLDDAVNIGGAHSPSLELLIASDPDFVLASVSTASHVELQATLEAMGIPVAYFDVNCFDDYLNMLNICTDITGRKDLYGQNGLAIRTQIDEIKALYATADIPQSQRTVLLLRAASGFVKAKGSGGTILGEMLEDMGCINIADTDRSLLENLSVEAVIQQQPYHIFVVIMGNDTAKAIQSLDNMMKETPAWGTLDAVEGGRLHWMDKRLFNLKPNIRWAESYRILYEKLTEI